MNPSPPAPPAPAPTDKPVDLSRESVAGEEDPGASIDTTLAGNAPGKQRGTGESPCEGPAIPAPDTRAKP